MVFLAQPLLVCGKFLFHSRITHSIVLTALVMEWFLTGPLISKLIIQLNIWQHFSQVFAMIKISQRFISVNVDAWEFKFYHLMSMNQMPNTHRAVKIFDLV